VGAVDFGEWGCDEGKGEWVRVSPYSGM